MNSTVRVIVFGVLVWLVVFIGAVVVFPVKQSNPAFFETLITIILCTVTIITGRLFFSKGEITLRRSLLTGLAWAVINTGIDLPLFLYGPMKRPFTDYMTDIGLTYLIIPVILSAFAYRR